jgi:hypothetical protein
MGDSDLLRKGFEEFGEYVNPLVELSRFAAGSVLLHPR